ncbi:hypothetical protein EC973_000662 [Apophysomyces ossiformis]|uniref:Acid phosphatase n=1 Tax=Apophysomyces ossiformis TaxID=679940 RepID=A0A8H7BYE4_9FUNG|nr:hypothetical protein EC973_000662 [Apophysomyces ossiformis]
MVRERTPVRKRLEKFVPAVWNVCDANRAMFATIAMFAEKQELESSPLQRLLETEHKTEEAGACYYGQLTNMGRKNMTSLGNRLREIYIDKLQFLPDIFEDNAVYLRSTDYPRTQESVQQLIAGGLYPPEKRLPGFALKIRTRDPRVDNMFPNPNCNRLRQLAKEFKHTVAEMCADQMTSISERLKNHVKEVSLDSHPSANGIMDTLISAKVHGFSLPEDIDDTLMRDLEDVVVKEWFYGAIASQEVRRLGLGRLAGDIQDRMVRRADGSDKKIGEDGYKLAVYSGHDTTVGPLLIILGGFDMRWPPFGSSIIFELFKQKGSSGWKGLFSKQEDHYVRVRYNNKVLELPGCADKGNHHANGDKSLCTLDAFKKIVKDSIPDNWAEECSV